MRAGAYAWSAILFVFLPRSILQTLIRKKLPYLQVHIRLHQSFRTPPLPICLESLVRECDSVFETLTKQTR
jgi:hypothetical protein